jgi:hypothetical protein
VINFFYLPSLGNVKGETSFWEVFIGAAAITVVLFVASFSFAKTAKC